MADRIPVHTDRAPAAVGPYSQGILHGDLLFCSGQIPLDPATGELVAGDVAAQARQCLQNLEAVCEAGTTRLAYGLRLTVYLTDLSGDWASVNAAYEEFFPSQPPARVAIGVAALPKGASVEIDAVVAVL
jgi:reactive intermediate/imine deaminase